MSQKVRMDMLPRCATARHAGHGRQGKSLMIDELCEQFGYSRKHAIKLLNARSGWGGEPCGKRLKALLKIWLPTTRDEDGKLDASIGKRRGSAPLRSIVCRLQQSHTKVAGVAHCGGSLAGDFVWSVTYTDIHSGLDRQSRARWNKGAHGIVTATQDVKDRLPFAILGFDCENGSEFPNHHLVNYFTDRKKKVGFYPLPALAEERQRTRGTKELTHVRQLLGYQRLEGP